MTILDPLTGKSEVIDFTAYRDKRRESMTHEEQVAELRDRIIAENFPFLHKHDNIFAFAKAGEMIAQDE